MNVSKKLRWIFFCSLPNFSRYSLTILVSIVLLSESVGATRAGTQLQITQQPEATSGAAIRAAAKRASYEGLQLYKQGTTESLRQAVKKLEEALPLWRQVKDKAGEARTLNNIGKVYDHLDEKQQALNYFNSSLLLRRQVENKALEAITLHNIGLVYNALGDKQQALNYFNSSLLLRRQVEDKALAVTTISNIALVENDRGNL